MTNYYNIVVSSPGPQGPPGPSASYASTSGSATYSTNSSSSTFSSSAAVVTSASGIPTRWFGSFYSSVTQTISNTASAYAMILGNTDYNNGVVNNGSSITFSNTGIYNVQWSGQFKNTSNSDQDIYIWLRKNGSEYAGSTGLVSVPSAHGGTDGHVIAGWNYILSMNAGENIEFYWGAQSTAVTLQYYASATNPVRPDTVSLIVTAVQV